MRPAECSGDRIASSIERGGGGGGILRVKGM
jgi:hypothetical protein